MKLRGKLLLVALLPLLATLGLTALLLRHQQLDLGARQRELVRAGYNDFARAELRHYVALALSTLSPLYNTGRDDDEIKRQAIEQLAHLDYGHDGYFFLYDYDGTNLMHPRQPELVGRNLLEMRDASGRPAIRRLIDTARAGGGFVEYDWNKPSSRTSAPKLGYVTGLERWHWMIGTGIYTDDLDRVITQLDHQLDSNLRTTMGWIAAAALAAIAIVVASLLGLGLSELRAADAKLTLLARKLVHSQEEERAWLSRELHDGTSQTLVSVKLLTESALERLDRPGQDLRPVLARALDRVTQALGDVRDMSHRLRPAELDTLGLGTALRQLGEEMGPAAGLRFEMSADSASDALPDEIKTTLFRVGQEALANVVKHAGASRVRIELDQDGDALRLRIEDDGRGFDSEAMAQHPRRGIGLRNMRERLTAIGGNLRVESRPQRTLLLAEVPAAALRRFARSA